MPGIAATRFARQLLAETASALTCLFFPDICRNCDALLTHARRVPICDGCIASFERIAGRICFCCGRPMPEFTAMASEDPQGDRCADCRERSFSFSRARSFALYDGALVTAILMLKFEEIAPLGKLFAEHMAGVVPESFSGEQFDVVVPVPLHKDRQKERGYNQADVIARPLAKLLRLPRKPVLLVRTRPRPDKRVLSTEERWKSVRGAFTTRPGSQVDNLRVLLVDDVMTTGATLDACAQALLDAGAKSVCGLTVARAAN